MDVTYLALRQGSQGKEGALGVYGILENGKKVLLQLALGSQEFCEAWLSFLVSCRQEMKV
jgi:transposase-like protein